MNLNFPDDSISISDMNDYGYTWDGMLPLSESKARELYNMNASIYRLYEDNSEGLINNISEFSEHRGLFGIERCEWAAFDKSEEMDYELEI